LYYGYFPLALVQGESLILSQDQNHQKMIVGGTKFIQNIPLSNLDATRTEWVLERSSMESGRRGLRFEKLSGLYKEMVDRSFSSIQNFPSTFPT